MKITKDGFIWKIVTDQAHRLFNSEIFELYALRDDDSEYLIKTYTELCQALNDGLKIGLEVGRVQGEQLQNPNNTMNVEHILNGLKDSFLESMELTQEQEKIIIEGFKMTFEELADTPEFKALERLKELKEIAEKNKHRELSPAAKELIKFTNTLIYPSETKENG